MGLDEREVGDVAVVLDHVVRISAAEERIEEPAVLVAVDAAGCGAVARVVAGRDDGAGIERDADLPRAARAQRPDREPVGDERVVGRGDGLGLVADAGGVDADLVPEERRAPRLVERHPVRDFCGERVDHQPGVLREALRGVARGPASVVLALLGEVPVVRRRWPRPRRTRREMRRRPP